MKKGFFLAFGAFLLSSMKEHISMAIVCVMLYFLFRNMASTLVLAVILAFIVLYGTSMAICYYGMAKLEKHQRSGSVSPKRLFGFSVLIAMPIYYLWAVVSLIPIVQYEIWLLTGLPLVIITGLTLSSIAEHWRENRVWFWLFQVGVYLCMLCGGQGVIHLLLR